MTFTTNHRTSLLIHLLTFLRLILSWVLCIYLMNHFGSLRIPIMLSLIIYLTDYLDGKAARFFQSTSLFGTVFDAVTDLVYISMFYMTLYYFNLVPLWFLGLMLWKFFEFVLTSYVLCEKNATSTFVFDHLGRVTACLFYVIPLGAYVCFVCFGEFYGDILPAVLYMTTTLALISSAYRLRRCLLSLSQFRENTCSYCEILLNVKS